MAENIAWPNMTQEIGLVALLCELNDGPIIKCDDPPPEGTEYRRTVFDVDGVISDTRDSTKLADNDHVDDATDEVADFGVGEVTRFNIREVPRFDNVDDAIEEVESFDIGKFIRSVFDNEQGTESVYENSDNENANIAEGHSSFGSVRTGESRKRGFDNEDVPNTEESYDNTNIEGTDSEGMELQESNAFDNIVEGPASNIAEGELKDGNTVCIHMQTERSDSFYTLNDDANVAENDVQIQKSDSFYTLNDDENFNENDIHIQKSDSFYALNDDENFNENNDVDTDNYMHEIARLDASVLDEIKNQLRQYLTVGDTDRRLKASLASSDEDMIEEASHFLKKESEVDADVSGRDYHSNYGQQEDVITTDLDDVFEGTDFPMMLDTSDVFDTEKSCTLNSEYSSDVGKSVEQASEYDNVSGGNVSMNYDFDFDETSHEFVDTSKDFVQTPNDVDEYLHDFEESIENSVDMLSTTVDSLSDDVFETDNNGKNVTVDQADREDERTGYQSRMGFVPINLTDYQSGLNPALNNQKRDTQGRLDPEHQNQVLNNQMQDTQRRFDTISEIQNQDNRQRRLNLFLNLHNDNQGGLDLGPNIYHLDNQSRLNVTPSTEAEFPNWGEVISNRPYPGDVPTSFDPLIDNRDQPSEAIAIEDEAEKMPTMVASSEEIESIINSYKCGLLTEKEHAKATEDGVKDGDGGGVKDYKYGLLTEKEHAKATEDGVKDVDGGGVKDCQYGLLTEKDEHKGMETGTKDGDEIKDYKYGLLTEKDEHKGMETGTEDVEEIQDKAMNEMVAFENSSDQECTEDFEQKEKADEENLLASGLVDEDGITMSDATEIAAVRNINEDLIRSTGNDEMVTARNENETSTCGAEDGDGIGTFRNGNGIESNNYGNYGYFYGSLYYNKRHSNGCDSWTSGSFMSSTSLESDSYYIGYGLDFSEESDIERHEEFVVMNMRDSLVLSRSMHSNLSDETGDADDVNVPEETGEIEGDIVDVNVLAEAEESKVDERDSLVLSRSMHRNLSDETGDAEEANVTGEIDEIQAVDAVEDSNVKDEAEESKVDMMDSLVPSSSTHRSLSKETGVAEEVNVPEETWEIEGDIVDVNVLAEAEKSKVDTMDSLVLSMYMYSNLTDELGDAENEVVNVAQETEEIQAGDADKVNAIKTDESNVAINVNERDMFQETKEENDEITGEDDIQDVDLESIEQLAEEIEETVVRCELNTFNSQLRELSVSHEEISIATEPFKPHDTIADPIDTDSGQSTRTELSVSHEELAKPPEQLETLDSVDVPIDTDIRPNTRENEAQYEAVVVVDTAIFTNDKAIVMLDSTIVTDQKAIVNIDRAEVTEDRSIVQKTSAVVTEDETVLTKERTEMQRDRELVTGVKTKETVTVDRNAEAAYATSNETVTVDRNAEAAYATSNETVGRFDRSDGEQLKNSGSNAVVVYKQEIENTTEIVTVGRYIDNVDRLGDTETANGAVDAKEVATLEANYGVENSDEPEEIDVIKSTSSDEPEELDGVENCDELGEIGVFKPTSIDEPEELDMVEAIYIDEADIIPDDIVDENDEKKATYECTVEAVGGKEKSDEPEEIDVIQPTSVDEPVELDMVEATYIDEADIIPDYSVGENEDNKANYECTVEAVEGKEKSDEPKELDILETTAIDEPVEFDMVEATYIDEADIIPDDNVDENEDNNATYECTVEAVEGKDKSDEPEELDILEKTPIEEAEELDMVEATYIDEVDIIPDDSVDENDDNKATTDECTDGVTITGQDISSEINDILRIGEAVRLVAGAISAAVTEFGSDDVGPMTGDDSGNVGPVIDVDLEEANIEQPDEVICQPEPSDVDSHVRNEVDQQDSDDSYTINEDSYVSSEVDPGIGTNMDETFAEVDRLVAHAIATAIDLIASETSAVVTDNRTDADIEYTGTFDEQEDTTSMDFVIEEVTYNKADLDVDAIVTSEEQVDAAPMEFDSDDKTAELELLEIGEVDIVESLDNEIGVAEMQEDEIEVEEIKEDEIEVAEIKEDEIEVAEIKEDEIEFAEIKEDEIEVEEIKEDEIEVAEIKEDEIEFAEIKEDEIEVAEIKEDEIEVAEIKEDEIEVAEIKEDEIEVAEIKEDEIEVAEIKEDEIEVAEIKEDEIEFAEIKEDEIEVAEIKEDEIEVAEIKEDEIEVAEIKEDEIEVAEIKEDEIEVAEIKEDEIEVAEIKEDEIEVAEIKEDEIDVAEIKEDEIEDAEIKEDAIEVAEIKEDEIEVAEIKEDEIEVAEIKEDEIEVAVIKEDEIEVAVIKDDEIEVAVIKDDEIEVAEIKEDEIEVAEVKEDEIGVAEIKDDEIEDAEIKDDEIEVAEIKEDVIDVAEIKEDEIEVNEIKEDEIEVAEIKEDEIEVAEIKDDEIEVAEIKEDVIDVAVIKEDEIDVAEIKEDEIEVDEIKEDEIEVDEIKEDEIEVAVIKEDEIEVAEIKEDAIGVAEIKDDEIGVAEIKDDEIEVAGIQEDVIEVAEIKEDEIEVNEIKEDVIEVDEIKDDEIDVAEIKEDVIEVNEIKEDVIEVDEIKEDEIEVAEIKEDAIEAAEIKEYQIEVNEIKEDVIEVDEIKEDEIEVAEIKEDAIEAAEIKEDAIEVAEIKEDAIEAAEIKDDEIEVAVIKDDEIEVAEIKEDEIEVNEIKEDVIEVDEIKDDEIDVAEIKEDVIEVNEIKEDVIEVDEIKEDEIEVAEIKEDAIEAAEIKEYQIEVNEIKEDVIEVDEIKEDEIEVAEIKEDAIEAAEIKEDAIEVAEIKEYQIEVAEIKEYQIEVNEIKEDEIEVAEIKEDEIEVAEIKEDEIEDSEIIDEDNDELTPSSQIDKIFEGEEDVVSSEEGVIEGNMKVTPDENIIEGNTGLTTDLSKVESLDEEIKDVEAAETEIEEYYEDVAAKMAHIGIVNERHNCAAIGVEDIRNYDMDTAVTVEAETTDTGIEECYENVAAKMAYIGIADERHDCTAICMEDIRNDDMADKMTDIGIGDEGHDITSTDIENIRNADGAVIVEAETVDIEIEEECFDDVAAAMGHLGIADEGDDEATGMEDILPVSEEHFDKTAAEMIYIDIANDDITTDIENAEEEVDDGAETAEKPSDTTADQRLHCHITNDTTTDIRNADLEIGERVDTETSSYCAECIAATLEDDTVRVENIVIEMDDNVHVYVVGEKTDTCINTNTEDDHGKTDIDEVPIDASTISNDTSMGPSTDDAINNDCKLSYVESDNDVNRSSDQWVNSDQLDDGGRGEDAEDKDDEPLSASDTEDNWESGMTDYLILNQIVNTDTKDIAKSIIQDVNSDKTEMSISNNECLETISDDDRQVEDNAPYSHGMSPEELSASPSESTVSSGDLAEIADTILADLNSALDGTIMQEHNDERDIPKLDQSLPEEHNYEIPFPNMDQAMLQEHISERVIQKVDHIMPQEHNSEIAIPILDQTMPEDHIDERDIITQIDHTMPHEQFEEGKDAPVTCSEDEDIDAIMKSEVGIIDTDDVNATLKAEMDTIDTDDMSNEQSGERPIPVICTESEAMELDIETEVDNVDTVDMSDEQAEEIHTPILHAEDVNIESTMNTVIDQMNTDDISFEQSNEIFTPVLLAEDEHVEPTINTVKDDMSTEQSGERIFPVMSDDGIKADMKLVVEENMPEHKNIVTVEDPGIKEALRFRENSSYTTSEDFTDVSTTQSFDTSINRSLDTCTTQSVDENMVQSIDAATDESINTYTTPSNATNMEPFIDASAMSNDTSVEPVIDASTMSNATNMEPSIDAASTISNGTNMEPSIDASTISNETSSEPSIDASAISNATNVEPSIDASTMISSDTNVQPATDARTISNDTSLEPSTHSFDLGMVTESSNTESLDTKTLEVDNVCAMVSTSFDWGMSVDDVRYRCESRVGVESDMEPNVEFGVTGVQSDMEPNVEISGIGLQSDMETNVEIGCTGVESDMETNVEIGGTGVESDMETNVEIGCTGVESENEPNVEIDVLMREDEQPDRPGNTAVQDIQTKVSAQSVEVNVESEEDSRNPADIRLFDDSIKQPRFGEEQEFSDTEQASHTSIETGKSDGSLSNKKSGKIKSDDSIVQRRLGDEQEYSDTEQGSHASIETEKSDKNAGNRKSYDSIVQPRLGEEQEFSDTEQASHTSIETGKSDGSLSNKNAGKIKSDDSIVQRRLEGEKEYSDTEQGSHTSIETGKSDKNAGNRKSYDSIVQRRLEGEKECSDTEQTSQTSIETGTSSLSRRRKLIKAKHIVSADSINLGTDVSGNMTPYSIIPEHVVSTGSVNLSTDRSGSITPYSIIPEHVVSTGSVNLSTDRSGSNTPYRIIPEHVVSTDSVNLSTDRSGSNTPYSIIPEHVVSTGSVNLSTDRSRSNTPYSNIPESDDAYETSDETDANVSSLASFVAPLEEVVIPPLEEVMPNVDEVVHEHESVAIADRGNEIDDLAAPDEVADVGIVMVDKVSDVKAALGEVEDDVLQTVDRECNLDNLEAPDAVTDDGIVMFENVSDVKADPGEVEDDAVHNVVKDNNIDNLEAPDAVVDVGIMVVKKASEDEADVNMTEVSEINQNTEMIGDADQDAYCEVTVVTDREVEEIANVAEIHSIAPEQLVEDGEEYPRVQREVNGDDTSDGVDCHYNREHNDTANARDNGIVTMGVVKRQSENFTGQQIDTEDAMDNAIVTIDINRKEPENYIGQIDIEDAMDNEIDYLCIDRKQPEIVSVDFGNVDADNTTRSQLTLSTIDNGDTSIDDNEEPELVDHGENEVDYNSRSQRPLSVVNETDEQITDYTSQESFDNMHRSVDTVIESMVGDEDALELNRDTVIKSIDTLAVNMDDRRDDLDLNRDTFVESIDTLVGNENDRRDALELNRDLENAPETIQGIELDSMQEYRNTETDNENIKDELTVNDDALNEFDDGEKVVSMSFDWGTSVDDVKYRCESRMGVQSDMEPNVAIGGHEEDATKQTELPCTGDREDDTEDTELDVPNNDNVCQQGKMNDDNLKASGESGVKTMKASTTDKFLTQDSEKKEHDNEDPKEIVTDKYITHEYDEKELDGEKPKSSAADNYLTQALEKKEQTEYTVWREQGREIDLDIVDPEDDEWIIDDGEEYVDDTDTSSQLEDVRDRLEEWLESQSDDSRHSGPRSSSKSRKKSQHRSDHHQHYMNLERRAQTQNQNNTAEFRGQGQLRSQGHNKGQLNQLNQNRDNTGKNGSIKSGREAVKYLESDSEGWKQQILYAFEGSPDILVSEAIPPSGDRSSIGSQGSRGSGYGYDDRYYADDDFYYGQQRGVSRPESRLGQREISRPDSRELSRPESRMGQREISRPDSRELSRPESRLSQRELSRPDSRELSRPESRLSQRELSRSDSRELSRPESRLGYREATTYRNESRPDSSSLTQRDRNRLDRKMHQVYTDDEYNRHDNVAFAKKMKDDVTADILGGIVHPSSLNKLVGRDNSGGRRSLRLSNNSSFDNDRIALPVGRDSGGRSLRHSNNSSFDNDRISLPEQRRRGSSNEGSGESNRASLTDTVIHRSYGSNNSSFERDKLLLDDPPISKLGNRKLLDDPPTVKVYNRKLDRRDSLSYQRSVELHDPILEEGQLGDSDHGDQYKESGKRDYRLSGDMDYIRSGDDMDPKRQGDIDPRRQGDIDPRRQGGMDYTKPGDINNRRRQVDIIEYLRPGSVQSTSGSQSALLDKQTDKKSSMIRSQTVDVCRDKPRKLDYIDYGENRRHTAGISASQELQRKANRSFLTEPHVRKFGNGPRKPMPRQGSLLRTRLEHSFDSILDTGFDFGVDMRKVAIDHRSQQSVTKSKDLRHYQGRETGHGTSVAGQLAQHRSVGGGHGSLVNHSYEDQMFPGQGHHLPGQMAIDGDYEEKRGQLLRQASGHSSSIRSRLNKGHEYQYRDVGNLMKYDTHKLIVREREGNKNLMCYEPSHLSPTSAVGKGFTGQDTAAPGRQSIDQISTGSRQHVDQNSSGGYDRKYQDYMHKRDVREEVGFSYGQQRGTTPAGSFGNEMRSQQRGATQTGSYENDMRRRQERGTTQENCQVIGHEKQLIEPIGYQKQLHDSITIDYQHKGDSEPGSDCKFGRGEQEEKYIESQDALSPGNSTYMESQDALAPRNTKYIESQDALAQKHNTVVTQDQKQMESRSYYNTSTITENQDALAPKNQDALTSSSCLPIGTSSTHYDRDNQKYYGQEKNATSIGASLSHGSSDNWKYYGGEIIKDGQIDPSNGSNKDSYSYGGRKSGIVGKNGGCIGLDSENFTNVTVTKQAAVVVNQYTSSGYRDVLDHPNSRNNLQKQNCHQNRQQNEISKKSDTLSNEYTDLDSTQNRVRDRDFNQDNGRVLYVDNNSGFDGGNVRGRVGGGESLGLGLGLGYDRDLYHVEAWGNERSGGDVSVGDHRFDQGHEKACINVLNDSISKICDSSYDQRNVNAYNVNDRENSYEDLRKGNYPQGNERNPNIGIGSKDNRRGKSTIMRLPKTSGNADKDGPLSLADTGTLEDMDRNHGDSRSNQNLAQSPTPNKLSESVTSLNNRQAPANSPSRQSTLTHQQSLQSNQSEVNGDKKEEQTGIKFERLKNLSEEVLMEKIKEIIVHLEKLEDYHRGDGMRIQKMLCDMYWDYYAIREMIADCMADNGYAAVSMKMLKTLNSIGIFKNDDVWFPTYYTYNTMWNFSDASSKLAKAFSGNDAVRLLTLNCGHQPYIKALHSKNVFYVIKASLSILHNIARNSGMKHLFDENKTSETIMPFINSEDDMLKILATLTIANIVDEEENKTLIAETGTIHCTVSWIEKAISLPRRRFKGFTPQELTEGLNKLAVNDSNKMKIIEEGAMPLFLQMLQHEDVREQGSAARVIWTLAFDKEVRQKLLENTELIAVLEKLCDSTNKSVQTNANGALWVIKGENEISREASTRSSKGKQHVFLSYSWSDKDEVLHIRDRLRAEGYAIWIDIEKMGGSTLEAMAHAVENAAVVLVCMSEKYKQSPNCRTEAEYTFQLKKDYIPLMMQKKYRPDGWLGIILGAKLYFDFSGKYPFDKSFTGLLKELRGRGQVDANHTPSDSINHTDSTDGPLVASNSLISYASPGTPVPSNSVICSMGQEELVKWLRNCKLTECIPAFLEFDGRLLLQLKQMRQEAPEFFYSCLERRLNMSLIEILKFTRALEELH